MPRENNTPDILIERAAEIWSRALRRPRFDNGDTSEKGFLSEVMATNLMAGEANSVDDIDAAIDRFKDLLVTRLKHDRDNEGKPDGGSFMSGGQSYPTHHRMERFLSTDYHPCKTLDQVAAEVGVPESLFSWKSTVRIEDDHVSASFGYGAGPTNHYPLPGGRWLITKLRGEDMPQIMQAVMDGLLPEMLVEGAPIPLVTPVRVSELVFGIMAAREQFLIYEAHHQAEADRLAKELQGLSIQGSAAETTALADKMRDRAAKAKTNRDMAEKLQGLIDKAGSA